MESSSAGDIATLPAGPILDALIAGYYPGLAYPDRANLPVSTDVQAAGALVHYLEDEEGWHFALDLVCRTCRVTRGTDWEAEAHGETLPLAISRAVLYAIRRPPMPADSPSPAPAPPSAAASGV